MLSSKERLTRIFTGKDYDRVPIWLLFPYHRLGCYADVYNIPCYRPIIERIEKGDCDSFDRRGVSRNMLFTACPDVKFIDNTYQSGGDTIRETQMQYKDLCFTKRHTTGSSTEVKYYIDDPDDLLKLLEIPYVPLKPDLSVLRRERAEFGDKGLFMMDVGDPLCVPYNLFSATDFSMMTATHYEELLEFLDAMSQRVLDLYRYLLENDVCDCYFIVGAEFAGPPIVSPKRFNELSARYVKQITDLIRGYGKISIVHYHGNLYHVREGMKLMNPDGLHTVELPPIGDCTLGQAREGLGDNMTLIGPVQYDDIIRQSVDEIEAQVKDAIKEAAGGRFILSPSAGPYETYLDEHAVKNYLRLIDSGLKYGGL